jgi:hypothetical protein
VAPGLLALRFAHHSERAWSLLVRVSHTAMSGSNIAQAVINAHCGRLTPAKVEILSVIEMHMPDVRLWVPEWPGSSPPAKVRSDRGSTRPCGWTMIEHDDRRNLHRAVARHVRASDRPWRLIPRP